MEVDVAIPFNIVNFIVNGLPLVIFVSISPLYLTRHHIICMYYWIFVRKYWFWKVKIFEMVVIPKKKKQILWF